MSYRRPAVTPPPSVACFFRVAICSCIACIAICLYCTSAVSASEMTYIVSSGALNSTHSLTHLCRFAVKKVVHCLLLLVGNLNC